MHPALSQLYVIGLVLFWLMPLSAWLMLKGQRDANANLWFTGTLCYAIAGLMFTQHGQLPAWMTYPSASAMATATVLLMSESLRRELTPTPTRWAWLAAVVAAEWLALVAVVAGGFRDPVALPLHLALITAVDVLVLSRIIRINRTHQGLALWIVAVAFGAAVISNISRLAWQLITGQPVSLTDFSLLSRIAFIVNYTGVIFYSFGYWGFVLEKSHARTAVALADSRSARARESSALERERAVQELLRERESLIAKLARMQRAAQAGALTASMAHEINQPLAAIRLDLEQAQLHLAGSLSPAGDLQIGKLVDRSLSQTLRAARMVRTLRDVFSARELVAEPRSMKETIGSVADLLQQRAEECRVELSFDLAGDVVVRAAGGELEHVVLNLVVNALEAAQHAPQGVPCVVVRTWMDGQRGLLQVIDNGPGIDGPTSDCLFELLHTSKEEGMGLGLWLSRHIVERHGGRITLERGQPGDTRFLVDLPLAPFAEG